MNRHIFAAAAALLLFASGATAQSFAALEDQAALGTTLYVIDTSGEETNGRIVKLSGLSLTLHVNGTRQQFAMADIARVERRKRESVRKRRGPVKTLLSIELRDAADGWGRRDGAQPRVDIRELAIRERLRRVRDHLLGWPPHVARECRPGRDATRKPRPGDAAALCCEPMTLPAGTFDEELPSRLDISRWSRSRRRLSAKRQR